MVEQLKHLFGNAKKRLEKCDPDRKPPKQKQKGMVTKNCSQQNDNERDEKDENDITKDGSISIFDEDDIADISDLLLREEQDAQQDEEQDDGQHSLQDDFADDLDDLDDM